MPEGEVPVPDADATPPALALEDGARLLAAARDLAAARELGRILEIVRRAARDLTGSDGVTFVLREGNLVHYADEEAIGPLWKGCRFPIDSCISGWAMIHRETAIVEDIARDARIPLHLYRPTFVQSLAMVPVGDPEPVAAIGAYWARRHRATAREREALETLAGFAALALANDALVRDLRAAVGAREEFITVAAHELRTPLAALTLTLQSAARRRARAEDGELAPLRRNLDRAQRHAARLTKLVDTLLDVSRVAVDLPLELERIDLARLAAEVVAHVEGADAARVTLRTEGAVEGRWDSVRLQQIVENLVSNALKFGGDHPVEVEVSRTGDLARLVVTDGGPGISPENRDRIFGKFERGVSTQHFGGLGLGLWIVRLNVEAHGGTIDVESRPGAGSRFVVVLPTGDASNIEPLRTEGPDRARTRVRG